MAKRRTNRPFFTKVAGVTFEGRQRIVARCSVGERLVLIRDPENCFDKGAIKVVRSNGQQLGFVPAHVSRSGDSSGLANRMDRGDQYECRIRSITGGGWRNLGVNIEITEATEVEEFTPGDALFPAGEALLPTNSAPVNYGPVIAIVILAVVAVLFLYLRG